MHTAAHSPAPARPVPAGAPRTLVVANDHSESATRAMSVAESLAPRFSATVAIVGPPADAGASTSARDICDDLDRTLATVEQPAVCVIANGYDHVAFHQQAVIEHVLRAIPGPAVIVGPHCSAPPALDGPIVVGHDGSEASTAVFATARVWAHALDVPIVLAHVCHPLDLATAEQPRAVVGDALEQLGPAARFELVRATYPAGALRELAHELDASLLAMSTHGRTGLARILLGSVTARVGRESSCPILVQRPTSLSGT